MRSVLGQSEVGNKLERWKTSEKECSEVRSQMEI